VKLKKIILILEWIKLFAIKSVTVYPFIYN
jgi:hypothetical protein